MRLQTYIHAQPYHITHTEGEWCPDNYTVYIMGARGGGPLSLFQIANLSYTIREGVYKQYVTYNDVFRQDVFVQFDKILPSQITVIISVQQHCLIFPKIIRSTNKQRERYTQAHTHTHTHCA